MKVMRDLCVSMLYNQLIGIIKTEETTASEIFYDTQGNYMQRKSPGGWQPLSFFKSRNNTQKGTRVVTGRAIKHTGG